MRVFPSARFRLATLLILVLSSIQAQNGSIFSQKEVVITLSDCSGTALSCLGDFTPGEVPDFSFILDGNPYSGPFPACQQDTLGIYSYEFLFGKGNAGPYRLDSWMVNGQLFSGQFQDMPALVDSMNVWDPSGNWTLYPGSFQIRGGKASSVYSQMLLTVLSINTPGVIGYNVSYTTIALGIPVDQGIHQLIALNQQNGDLDTLVMIAGCNDNTELLIQTEIGWTDSTCMDLSTLTGSLQSIENLCGVPNYPAGLTKWNPVTGCINWTGTAIGTDTLCLIACDSFGFCSTTTVYIQVLYPGALSALLVSVGEGDTLVQCLDVTSLSGNLISVTNLCPEGAGTFAQIDMMSGQACVSIIGIQHGGPEYACFQLCDDLGFCDTQTIEIKVLFHHADIVNLETGLFFDELFCPDLSAFPGSTFVLSNGCPGQSGTATMIQIDPLTNCLEFVGIAPGQDTVCLLVEDEFGNQSVTTLYIDVVKPSISVDSIQVEIGSSESYCPDLSELAGTIVSISNACPNGSGAPFSVTLDPLGVCATVNGDNIGSGQICLVVCNTFGVCDTTQVVVTVIQPVQEAIPFANNDQWETTLNQAVNISVLQNDSWGGSIPEVQVISGSGPLNGSIVVEQNGSITYDPDHLYCGQDQFSYSLCTAAGCDTALVTIEIHCEEEPQLVAYTGFSPNGDGINEYFTIGGLAAFPRNTLEVYNRWGNRIFIKTDYQGDWDGTWGGLVLPDGTYFYIFKPEGNDVLSGYVHLHR